jgi:hypothetical protein
MSSRPSQRIPSDFTELLSARGRRILAGREREVREAIATPQRRFLAVDGALNLGRVARLRDAMSRELAGALSRMESPIPPEATWSMSQNYSEQLPKTVAVSTALLESSRSRASRLAREMGLVALLRSPGAHAFAQALCSRPLRPRWGIQVLRYGPGDYAGPHNDHHPEDAEGRDGYFDFHVSLPTKAVAHQWLVYERQGHFSEVRDVNILGAVTAYKLPFWHYTTPLVARRGRQADAARWVLLATFEYAR